MDLHELQEKPPGAAGAPRSLPYDWLIYLKNGKGVPRGRILQYSIP